MEIHLSTVQYTLNGYEVKFIEKRVARLKRLLENMQSDIPMANLVIHKHLNRAFVKTNGHAEKVGHLKKIDVVLSLHLLKASLHAKYEGRVVHIGLKEVFDSIENQIKKYKQKHFSSLSDYPDHRSLRRVRY